MMYANIVMIIHQVRYPKHPRGMQLILKQSQLEMKMSAAYTNLKPAYCLH